MNNIDYEKEKIVSFKVYAKNPRSNTVYNGKCRNSNFFDKYINKAFNIGKDQIMDRIEFDYYISYDYIKNCKKDQNYNDFNRYMEQIDILRMLDI